MATALVTALAVTALPFLLQRPELQAATPIEGGAALPEVTLTDQDGEPFVFGDTEGRHQLVFFGYINCPDVCPLTLGRLGQALQQMGSNASQVQVVFVSVDPERDSLERLRTHVSTFGPEFVGVTGLDEQLQEVTSAFGVYYEKVESDSASGYLMSHSSHVTVVDPAGRIRAIFPFEANSQAIAADMRVLVK